MFITPNKAYFTDKVTKSLIVLAFFILSFSQSTLANEVDEPRAHPAIPLLDEDGNHNIHDLQFIQWIVLIRIFQMIRLNQIIDWRELSSNELV